MSVERKSYPMPGGTMSALHFNAEQGPVRLVFAHANGFNGLSYRRVLEQLPVHSVALDLRGHGFTKLPTDIESLDSFHIFGDDIATFVGRYVPGKIVLAGHSFGAVGAILASMQLRDRLAGYVGFDPVSMPWLGRQMPRFKPVRAYMKKRVSLMRKAGQRRRQFDSLESAFERYKGRGAFKGISDEGLRDYLEGGLLPDGVGVRLACEPKWEQAIYCGQSHNLYKAAVDLPEHSEAHYAGKFAVSSKATRAKLGKVIGSDNIHFNPEFSHMFPLQKPDYAAGVLSALIKRVAQG